MVLIEQAPAKARSQRIEGSAATLRAIEDAAGGATDEPLHDDATLVVLAVPQVPST